MAALRLVGLPDRLLLIERSRRDLPELFLAREVVRHTVEHGGEDAGQQAEFADSTDRHGEGDADRAL